MAPFMTRLAITLILSLLATHTAQAEVYRWVDEQGRVIFGDSPPKEKQAEAKRITIENTEKSGARFATPQQIKDYDQQSQARQVKKNPAVANQRIDSRCRNYISQLNKVEIYLEHTPTVRDQQKARDLRKLINQECGDVGYQVKHDDAKCQRYRDDLSKAKIYLEHTPNARDQRKVKDLRTQINRECL